MDTHYTLAYPFLDDSESFANGFSCGRISFMMGMKLMNIDTRESIPIQSELSEQIRLMADHYGYEVEFHPVYIDGKYQKEWLNLTAKLSTDSNS